MATNDYDCADDLLGKRVLMVMRVPGLLHEVEGRVIAVSGSVPGEWFAGIVQVLWKHKGNQRIFDFDLATGYCPERIW